MSTLMVFFVVMNLVWWTNQTCRLVRVLDGQLLTIVVTHFPPALLLWFTGVLTILVVPALAATWLLWRGRPRWGLALALMTPVIAYGLARWGDDFFPLVSGPGGYYVRTWPLGGH